MARFLNASLPLLLAVSLLPTRASADSLSSLQRRLDARLNSTAFARAQWGLQVASLDSGKILFQHNADKLLKPASNAKLFTAALALDRLGPDYRIKTSFFSAARPGPDGILHGDLIVYGRGDPSFSARFNGGDDTKALQPALDALKAAGIQRIDGDLVGDDSFFHGPPYGLDWTWDDLQNYYGAPASALSFQDNTIDLIFHPGAAIGAPCPITALPATTFVTFSNWTRTVEAGAPARIRIYQPPGENVAYVWGGVPLGSAAQPDSVPVSRPALWFVTMLKEALAQNGITLSGSVSAKNWLDRQTAPLDISNLVEVASVQSQPVAGIVKLTLKQSENLYAQLLLMQVGAVAAANHPQDAGDDTAEQAGLAEMQRFLLQAGIDPGTARLDDGSGLSRSSLATPAAIVKLLTFMSRHRCRDVFVNALPVAGVDGTLRNRFKNTAAQGNVRAKTGSLDSVDTLSGFLTDAGGENLVFSIMLNNYIPAPPELNGRAEIDQLVRLLADFRP